MASPGLRAPLRRLWRLLHLWLGLTVGLGLSLIGLSGALLVFEEPLLRWEHRETLFPAPPSPGSRQLPLDRLVAALQEVDPQARGYEIAVAPGAAAIASTAALLVKDAPGGHDLLVIDPWTGRRLGAFLFEDGWAALPRRIHTTLLLPEDIGSDLVAWVGAASLVSVLTGVVLWWPGWRNLPRGFRIRRRAGGAGRRVHLGDLHGASAAVLIPAILALLITGLAIVRTG